MGEGVAEAFFIAGTVPFIVAGAGHALGALIDTRRPTFFKPIDDPVIPAMKGTGLQLRVMFPGSGHERPSMWQAWLGFNISHGIGVASFGLVLLLLALHDFELVEEVGAIQPLSVGVGLAYFLVSIRFWFYGPTIASGIGSACFTIAALA